MRKAFTLIEVLVVIAIACILVALVYNICHPNHAIYYSSPPMYQTHQ